MIALADLPTQPRWHARVFDKPTVSDIAGCAWRT
jgi:hypothetical protein